jgi:2-(1,2-epoxy-1,2-dihydrophenyl)acetyl-CoA isomerase
VNNNTGDTLRVVHEHPVLYTCSNGIAVATLAEPTTRNALSPELLDALDAACEVAVEEKARALVLTGAGRTFCAGGDLAGVNDALESDGVSEIGEMVDRLHRVIVALRALPMPTVAAVNGAAVGAGVSLAMATDVRVLARSASFLTGYLAVGASPDGGASYHLARSLGGPQALSSFLLNKRFTAEQLEQAGLADRLVDDADLLTEAKALAGSLAELSFPTVRAVRDLVDQASSHSLHAHLDAEKAHFVDIARTPEFRDGVAPFARRAVSAAQA